MVFRTESQELPFTYPPAPEPSGEVRQALDAAVAALNADEKNPALRKALAALLAEPYDGAHFLCEWGGWRYVTETTRATIRPGCEVEARAWLVGQGVSELPNRLTETKLARIIDHNGLITPERLFRTSQRDMIRRA